MTKKRNLGQLPGLTNKQTTFLYEYMKDLNPRRAAEASGYDPDQGYKLIENEAVKGAIESLSTSAWQEMQIDAEWVLWELVDNHKIARQHGNISASNTALKTIMQHVDIDAMAKQKMEVDVTGDKEMVERLHRGRRRIAEANGEGESFL